MATKQDDPSRNQRLVALGAIGLLASATAVAFARVFVGHGSTWRLLAAALGSVAVAVVFERRSLLLATLASAVALVVMIAWLIYPETTWYGLPSRETLEAIGEALGKVGRQARMQVAPTPPLEPLLLAALTAVWTASFSAHALASRAGSPLLAVLPSAALVGFADTVLEDGARPMYAMWLLGAALLVVFVDALRRVRRWGPIWTSPGRRRLSSVAGRGARRVGLVAVGVALLVPGILPGFRADPLIDLSTSGGGDLQIDPFVSIRADLRREEPVDLFEVRSVDEHGNIVPSYWRLYSLDQFDGTGWSSSDPTGERALTMNSAVQLPLIEPVPEGSGFVTQRFRMVEGVDAGRWLPAAYPPQAIYVPSGEIRFQRELAGILAVDSIGSDEGYAVTSRRVLPTSAELSAVSIPPELYPRWTFVPDTVSAELRQIAKNWTAGAKSQYEQVFAIQQGFHEEGAFRYTLTPRSPGGANPILEFVTRTKEGFCQQFATAMAAMVRSLGIPARVAIGYRTGSPSGEVFRVQTDDAHSWVEVMFPGYGWLAFDPTPGDWTNPIAEEPGSYLNPGPGAGGLGDGTATNGEAGSPTGLEGCVLGGRPVQGRICQDPFAFQGQPVPGPGGRGRFGEVGPFAPPQDRYGVPLAPVLIGIGLVALALLVLIPLAKAAVRHHLLHRRRDPRIMVLFAYRVFDGEAAELGLGRRQGETLEEHRRRLASAVRFSDGHLSRLTSVAARAAYSGAPVGAEEARAAITDAKVAIRDVRRQAGRVRRLLGVYQPRL